MQRTCLLQAELAAMKAVLNATKPIFVRCINSRSSEHWLLSESVYSYVQVCINLIKIAVKAKATELSNGESSLEGVNAKFYANMASCSLQYVSGFLNYTSQYDEPWEHYIVSLMLDPQYMGIHCIKYFYCNQPIHITKQLIKKYKDHLVSISIKIYSSTN